MNSKNFIIAVAVVISFFAACFVWEARSALPGEMRKDISVGGCINGHARKPKTGACQASNVKNCDTQTSYNTYIFPCGEEGSVQLHTYCASHHSESACTESNGYILRQDQEGDYVDNSTIGGCGPKEGYKCVPGLMQSRPVTHVPTLDCPGCSIIIDEYPCKKSTTPVPNLNCGNKSDVKGC